MQVPSAGALGEGLPWWGAVRRTGWCKGCVLALHLLLSMRARVRQFACA